MDSVHFLDPTDHVGLKVLRRANPTGYGAIMTREIGPRRMASPDCQGHFADFAVHLLDVCNGLTQNLPPGCRKRKSISSLLSAMGIGHSGANGNNPLRSNQTRPLEWQRARKRPSRGRKSALIGWRKWGWQGECIVAEKWASLSVFCMPMAAFPPLKGRFFPLLIPG